MRSDVRENPWSRLTIGLIILATGVIFWLDQVDRIDAAEYLSWWPLAVIAVGLAHLPDRRWGAGLIWIAVGTFFLLPMIGYQRPSVWWLIGMWPLLISVAGVTLVVQALRPGRGARDFTAVAVMAGNVRRLASPSAGGQAIAFMGGCEIEVSREAFTADEIIIDVLAFWGGIVIRVPPGCTVINHVAPILGGVEDKTSRGASGGPRLVVRGSAIMGGVEIRNLAESVS